MRLEGKKHYGIGPQVEVFLDGERIDADGLLVIDEELGYVVGMERRETPDRWGLPWKIDPATGRPFDWRRDGRVEIRLREDAPQWAREIYDGLRAGTLVAHP